MIHHVIDEETQPVAGESEDDRVVSAHPVFGGRVSGSASESPATLATRWLAEHGDVLWRFVRGRVGSNEVAEEIVQETMLAAMQGYAKFAGGSSERTWLLGISAHKIADHFRTDRRRRGAGAPLGEAEPGDADHVAFHAMFTADGFWTKQPREWGRDAGSRAENDEILAALRGCIGNLPPSQAEVILLRDLLSIPAVEVCKALDISPTNLWSRIHRARAALRGCVEKSMGLGKEDAE